MKFQFLIATAVATLLIALQNQNSSAQSYTVIDLGVPPNSNGNGSEAHGINQNGSIVGTWYLDKNPYSQYVFLYANGTNKDLGTIDSGNGNSYDYAVAFAINNTNQIVGQGTTNSYNNYHAFLNTNGAMIDLDRTGQSWSSANAINQRGQIAGEFTTTLGLTHAFIYTNGAFFDLGTLSGGFYSSAKGINDSNVIVGESTDASGNVFAFVYSNGSMTNLGTLGGNYSSAKAINNSGVVVGEAAIASGEIHAFIYSNSIIRDLGTLGGTNSSAAAITASGEIVGNANDSNQLSHAFVYSGSIMLNLDTVLSAHPPFTNLAYAYGINASGQICGGGLTTNGSYNAFLATPPALTLTCSSNITVTATNANGAIVSFSLLATGGCSQATVVAVPASGSLFPVGTNTVNVIAYDLCSHTNTCSFLVTVKPPVYPPIVLTVSSNITAAATSSSGAVVFFTNTATGGCSSPNVTSVPTNGSTFHIGVTTVTNTASDTCGNSTNGSFTVTVNPLPPIVLTCSSNITASATSSNGAIVNFPVTASGGCSLPNVTASPTNGSRFPIGTTTVTNTASDSCGTTTNCTFTVTVRPPPIVLTCPTNMTVTAISSNGAVVSFAATATGGCSSPNVVATPPSGSTFLIGITTVTNTASDTCGTTTNCTFTITVRPPPTPLQITSPAVTNNQFTMTIQGASNQTFVVQISTNLTAWVPLRTNTLLGTSTNLVDPNAPTNKYRFYRTLTLPQ